jgi:hypothetical protein
MAWLTGPDKLFNPSKHYIVILPLFGNSQSSSLSTMPDFRLFLEAMLYDNTRV